MKTNLNTIEEAVADLKKGKVIIQTYNPQHNIIQQVTQNDFVSMYKNIA